MLSFCCSDVITAHVTVIIIATIIIIVGILILKDFILSSKIFDFFSSIDALSLLLINCCPYDDKKH